MAITAAMVKELREMTGAGMMECKKALTETDGNMEAAVDVLKKSGAAKAEKKASRIAAEGIAKVAVDGNKAVVVEVNSETDFVAKNETFQAFVQTVADKALTLDVEKAGDGEDVVNILGMKAELDEKILTIGEKLSIRRFVILNGATGSYVHGGGASGCVTQFEVEGDIAAKPEFADFAKNICMQIVAMGPSYVCKNCVPDSVLANEKEIAMTLINNDPSRANKPDAIKEKMIEGSLKKFYESACLLEQGYVKEDKMTVAQYVEATGKELGGKIAVKNFVKYERGEGIEKREDDFAGEIEKLVKG